MSGGILLTETLVDYKKKNNSQSTPSSSSYFPFSPLSSSKSSSTSPNLTKDKKKMVAYKMTMVLNVDLNLPFIPDWM